MSIRRFFYLAGSVLLLLATWLVQQIPSGSLPAPRATLAASAGQQDIFSIQASLPMTPTVTGTPPPTDPEYLVLQYVADNHPSWYCGAITGTPGHRTLNACHPYGYFNHPTDGHVDRYGSPNEAYNQWLALRAAALGYPHFIDTYYRDRTGYEAGDDNFPYAHYESYYYYYAQSWVIGSVSSDDTNSWGAPPMAHAIIDAAWDLGYMGPSSPTPSPTYCVAASWGYGSPYSEPIMEEAMAPSGDLVYATGGRSNGTTVADTFVYDTITHNWSALAPQPQARHGSSALTVGNLIYVLNGENSSGNATNTIYGFDPALNSWTVAGNSLVSTWGQAAVLLNNNIYRITGCVSQDCTSTTNTVERNGQLVANYPASVGWPMAVALNGYIYVAGGTVGIGGPGTAKSYRYDPGTDTWDDSAIADLPDLRWGAASGVVNGRWVLAGGYAYTSVLDTAIEWNPATNTWSSTRDMPTGRGQPGSTVANNHLPRLYVAGGSPARGAFQGSAEVQQYLPDTCGAPAPTSTVTASVTTTPFGPTHTISPTPTGSPTVLCDVFYPSISSACQAPPSTYRYDFYALVYCPYGIQAEGTLEFDVAPSDSGPWTEWDQHPISGTLDPYSAHIYGTFTDSGIPSQYNWYRLIANVHTSNGQGLTATSLPAILCTGSTPTPVTRTPSPTATTCPIQFSDVPVGSTFYPFIRCLACRGIINGYPDGSFKPNNNVTRGELSKIVSNSAGFNDTPSGQQFQDVPVGSTFYVYIYRLVHRGYISGYPCGTPPAGGCVPPDNLPYFLPNANATRGQISKIDSNAADFSDPPSGQQFQDVPPGSTYYTYTYRLVTRSVMSGYPCGGGGEPCVPPGNLPYFRPNNYATRGQTSKVVSNTFFPGCQPHGDVKR